MTAKFISRKLENDLFRLICKEGVVLKELSRIGIEKVSSEGRRVQEVDIYVLIFGCRHYYDGDIIARIKQFFMHQAKASGSLDLKLYKLLKAFPCLFKASNTRSNVSFSTIEYY